MKQFEDVANLLINPDGSAPIFNCLLYLNDTNKAFGYSNSFGFMDASGAKMESNYRFRTGSITKTFTATIILQLIEEQLLDLDAVFLDCFINNNTKKLFSKIMIFEGVNYSNKITIKNLLQHRSGIRDYFADDDRFFKCIMDFPNQTWEWKRILEKYYEFNLNEKGAFEPDKDFYYSDTNYFLLAVLIEELTNAPFHEVLEKRILSPLALKNTYLEFYQNDKAFTPVVFPFHGLNSLKNVNTSFDWGGGGLISSASDLDIFIRALLAGKLFKKAETLQLMMNFEGNCSNNLSKKRATFYGLGLQQKKIEGQVFIGHSSAYGGMMFYNLETNFSVILSINQVLAPHKAEWFLKKIVETYGVV